MNMAKVCATKFHGNVVVFLIATRTALKSTLAYDSFNLSYAAKTQQSYRIPIHSITVKPCVKMMYEGSCKFSKLHPCNIIQVLYLLYLYFVLVFVVTEEQCEVKPYESRHIYLTQCTNNTNL